MARTYLRSFEIEECYHKSARDGELPGKSLLATYDFFGIDQKFVQCSLMVCRGMDSRRFVGFYQQIGNRRREIGHGGRLDLNKMV